MSAWPVGVAVGRQPAVIIQEGNLNARHFLDVIVHEIHTTIVATVDENGDPVTCAIDMMDCDDSGL